MNLADAIRQATQKVPAPDLGPELATAEEAVLQQLSAVQNVDLEDPATLPDMPSPLVFGGNVVRLELFLTPEQLTALFRSAVANHHTMMTLREAAAYLRIHASTVEQMAEDGKLPALMIDGRWRFLKSSIDEWLTLQRYTSEEASDAA